MRARNSRPRITFLAVTAVLVLFCAACDDGSEADVVEDTGPREGYPAGPYGVEEDSVVDNEAFTALDGSVFDFEGVYQDGANKLLLISTAAGWCAACREEQPKLQAVYDEYKARGLLVMVAYFEDANFAPASIEDAQDWSDDHALTLPVVLDEAFLMGNYYDRTFTPLNMIIDVSSMQILWMTTGWDESTVTAIIDSRI